MYRLGEMKLEKRFDTLMITSNQFENTSALLLAAGYGSRLKPLTNHTPKCLVTIGGVPLLEIWIKFLMANGISNIIVNSHYLHEQVADLCKKYEDIVTVAYEESLLGSVGTLHRNKKYLEKRILLIHADNFSVFSASEFVGMFESRENGVLGTMMTFTTDDPKNCGVVETNERNILTKYYQKVDEPPTNCANAAVFLLDEAIHSFIEPTSDHDFCADVVPRLIGKLNLYHNSVYHRDIGTIKSLRQANEDVMQNKVKVS
jgi:mannose-1-phosphate guanylyltransferase